MRVTIDFNARHGDHLVTASQSSDADGTPASRSRRCSSRREVKYPKEAKKNKITGKVALDVVVREDGTVEDVALDWACPQGYGLELAAAEAVRRWQFEPTVRHGVPVQGSTNCRRRVPAERSRQGDADRVGRAPSADGPLRLLIPRLSCPCR